MITEPYPPHEYYNAYNEKVISVRYCIPIPDTPIKIDMVRDRSPTKGDLVKWADKTGVIGWVSDGEVNVFFGEELETFDDYLFIGNYLAPRGKTIWRL